MCGRTGNVSVKETNIAKQYEWWVVVERYNRPRLEGIQHLKEDR